MKVDVYSVTGVKKGTVELPGTLFEAPINMGLMHQVVRLQQANRRHPIAHSKSRGEIRGSTRKLYQQKGTGRARRGSIRSPLLKGGNKAFGPSRFRNFSVDMPRKMRHAALRSCLSWQAKNGIIIGLESGTLTGKTKEMHTLLAALPVELGRRIVLVLPKKDEVWSQSARNIPRVKTVIASYLNPEDVLSARHIIFLVEALKKAEEVFGRATRATGEPRATKEKSKSYKLPIRQTQGKQAKS